MEQSISTAVGIKRGLTAIVGGGGKTTLMERLSDELSMSARVIISTSTHIRRSEVTTLIDPDEKTVRAAFERTNLLCVAGEYAAEKLCAPGISWERLTALADYVIVEADGSRGLPLKAPASHEPVIPDNAELVIAVAGMDGISGRIEDVCHRAELYASLIGKRVTDAVTPRDAAHVLTSVYGQKKNVRGDFCVVLNKADSDLRLSFARECAAYIEERTVIASLRENRICF